MNNGKLQTLLPPLLHDKAASKREQSDARIDSAEREQARPKVKTLVVLIQNGIGVEEDVQKMFPDVQLAAGQADAGKCATCKDTDKIRTDKTGCLYGCKTEDNNACTACNNGYKITEAGTCIKECRDADTATGSAKCSKCTTEANL